MLNGFKMNFSKSIDFYLLPLPKQKFVATPSHLRMNFISYIQHCVENEKCDELARYVKMCFIEDGLEDSLRKHFHISLHRVMNTYLVNESKQNLFWKLLAAVDQTSNESCNNISERYKRFKLNNCVVLAITIIVNKEYVASNNKELQDNLGRMLDNMYKLQKNAGNEFCVSKVDNQINEALNIVNYKPTF